MTGSDLPTDFVVETLRRDHPRERFESGHAKVDEWLSKYALQQQEKRLSVTRVARDKGGEIAGYYTLATAQVDFGDLPTDLVKKLPRRALPVAVMAWLGVSIQHQGQGIGRWLLARALRDCHDAGRTFAFIAVVVDCVDDRAKAFYQKWQFCELPGHPYRLYLSAARLEAMMLA